MQGAANALAAKAVRVAGLSQASSPENSAPAGLPRAEEGPDALQDIATLGVERVQMAASVAVAREADRMLATTLDILA